MDGRKCVGGLNLISMSFSGFLPLTFDFVDLLLTKRLFIVHLALESLKS